MYLQDLFEVADAQVVLVMGMNADEGGVHPFDKEGQVLQGVGTFQQIAGHFRSKRPLQVQKLQLFEVGIHLALTIA